MIAPGYKYNQSFDCKTLVASYELQTATAKDNFHHFFGNLRIHSLQVYQLPCQHGSPMLHVQIFLQIIIHQ